MNGLFMEHWARPFVIAHAVTGFAAAATAVHIALNAWTGRGRQPHARREGRFVLGLALGFGLCLLTGLLAYPEYRINVRALYFDHQAAWATNAFDIKENLGTLALPLVAAIVWLARRLRIGRDETAAFALRWYATGLAVALVACVLIGLTVALERGVG